MAGVPSAVTACEHWSTVQPSCARRRALVEVGHRPGQHQPAPRVRPVGVVALQPGVEVPRLVVVVPEAAQRVRARSGGPGLSWPSRGSTRRRVRRGTSRSTTRGRRRARRGPARRRPARRRAPARPARAGGRPAVRRAPMSHSTVIRPKTTTNQSRSTWWRTPCRGHRPASSRHGRQPSPGPKRAGPRRLPSWSASRSRARSRSTHQGRERRQRPEHQQRVEQRGAAVHEGHAVEGQQQAGDAAEQRRAEQPAADPRHDQHGQGARSARP